MRHCFVYAGSFNASTMAVDHYEFITKITRCTDMPYNPLGEIESQRADSGMGFLGRGSQPLPHQQGSLGEHCKLSTVARGLNPKWLPDNLHCVPVPGRKMLAPSKVKQNRVVINTSWTHSSLINWGYWSDAHRISIICTGVIDIGSVHITVAMVEPFWNATVMNVGGTIWPLTW